MSYLTRQNLLKRLSAAVACWMGVFLLSTTAMAQQQPGTEFQDITQTWLRSAVASAQPAGPAALRMDVTVGSLDSRLKLAACGNIEPYLPPGSRLWGKTRIGLRCVDGMSRWNVSLPVTVNAFGKAWVIKGQVPAGTALTAADVVEVEVNWAEEASPVLRDPALWMGQIATRLLTTGQTLRQGMVKPAQVFQAGAQVRVLAQGSGFQVTSDAQALSAGVVGQPARVRMENGRVTSGTVLDTRTVQIDL
jgi:flagella basal body P-ring formation protein FlgA